ncbi:hypothetical protein CHARACLAT_033655, partial [Characodon lateralis]|nr:hypothetical protein [Characodon lateralis]
QLVLVLASEPKDEGFEEEAPPDLVSEGSPGSASASERSPGIVSSKPDSRPDWPLCSHSPDCPELRGSSMHHGKPTDRWLQRLPRLLSVESKSPGAQPKSLRVLPGSKPDARPKSLPVLPG